MRGDDTQPISADAGLRARRGPRHAAPRKSLLTKFQIPAGKAMALAAMPTAVFVGMGLTPRLALADDSKDLSLSPGPCVTRSDTPGDSASPSASESGSPAPGSSTPGSTPSPSASSGPGHQASGGTGDGHGAQPGASPSPSASPSTTAPAAQDPQPSSTPSQDAGGGLLGGLGSALGGLLGGGSSDASSDAKAAPSGGADSTAAPLGTGGSPASSAAPDPAGSSGTTGSTGSSASHASTGKHAGPADTGGTSSAGSRSASHKSTEKKDAAEAEADRAADAAASQQSLEAEIRAAAKKAGVTVQNLSDLVKSLTPQKDGDIPQGADGTSGGPEGAQPFPCPTPDPQALADAQTEQGIPLVPDDPWTLKSSLLTLSGLDYKGIVDVKTSSGRVKPAMKFTASAIDIKDLQQSVVYPQGRTAHVDAAAGTTSTIRNGTVTMYTEKLTGNLLGLVPITFSPQTPPPVNLPFAFFTNATVTQAGQFGGTLTVPGLHNYITG